ncbi:MAG: hypothetical protein H6835_04090 [Planctomycetes bacterium]|nr:hypothetical protein [Planctomycetota bacterium]
MSKLYQELDGPHFDYELVPVAGDDRELYRGPAVPIDGPYIACIGGAQTFGRFVECPFPTQLSKRLVLPVLNLGLGGAGPRFALLPHVLRLLQGARLVVVQMFSGRSTSNSLFDNSEYGRGGGRLRATGEWSSFEKCFRDLFATGDRDRIERIVKESRDDYVDSMTQLAAALPCPKVLLWMSRREPAYTPRWNDVFGVLRHYPQLLDDGVVERLRPRYDAYVQCVSENGLPQRLWRAEAKVEGARLGDDGYLYNEYYPSPEGNDEVAAALEPVCRELLTGAAGQPSPSAV